MTSRRDILAGAAGLAAALSPRAAAARLAPAATDGDFAYDYLFVDVPRRSAGFGGPAPFVAHLTTAGGAAVTAAGGKIIGYFTPLIGWSSEQLAVLIRWPAAADPARERAIAAITRHPSAGTVTRSILAPTLRPAPHDRPKTTGIYTHRWFEIRTADLPEFVALSGGAWGDFEREFDATVFGLFRAQASADEQRRGVTRMLLNTHYASHAVWEASRTPSQGPADKFKRRSDMTLTTRVVSLHYTSIGD